MPAEQMLSLFKVKIKQKIRVDISLYRNLESQLLHKGNIMTDVRVRFAPSPTGFVHVGSLRTALYNYLFARHNNGRLVLRIEDTDQNRFVEGAKENLLRVMDWAGLDYDEGGLKGGPYGPYSQSERLDIYKKHIQSLLDNGNAYPCFCTAERLENMREEQSAKGESVMYDGACRHVPAEEANNRMKSEAHVVRLKIPEEGETVVDDIIRGRVAFQSNLLDDQVLIKSDGFPTYHLANVIDDHLMEITHVIRGEEWLPSTPKHILLYQAFGWQPPQFAHLPLLLNEDRSKLSKRQGDVAVEDYQNKGILPEALVNFAALLGWNRGDDQEIFSLQELVESFSLERVNKAGAVFDLKKLEWMNGHYIRNISKETYLQTGLEWMAKENLDAGSKEANQTILLAIRPSLNRFNEAADKAALIFNDELKFEDDALEWVQKEESKSVFKMMLSEIEKLSQLTLEDFKQVMKTVQKETGVKGQDLWMPVRAAMTGMTHGPELPSVLTVFGKNKVELLLKQALEK